MNTTITALSEEIVKSKGLETDLPEWGKVAGELNEVKTVLKALELKEKALKEKLVALSDNISRQNKEFLFECSKRAGGYDYVKIIKDYYVDLRPYRKESVTVWKLSKL